jgi:para-nitrobenzyl esterase
LNVWSGAGVDEARPVLVWVPGGNYTIGGSSLETYDLARLAAEQGVVAVSVNYRVGVLGFGAFEGAAPNRGLQDLVVALRWVRDHVAAFGGDPDRVTVFGESAGAGCLLHLLAMPSARGLFRRAILQSPGVHQTLTADQAGLVADAVLARLAGDDPRTVPWQRLVEAQTDAAMALYFELGAMPIHPWVDGSVLPGRPLDAVAAGDTAGVGLLVGWTEEELRLFPDPTVPVGDPDGFVRWVERWRRSLPWQPSVDGPLVAKAYGELVDGDERERSIAMTTDAMMRLPIAAVADAQSRHRPDTFAYQFTWKAPAPVGASHAVDLPFTFGTLDRCGWDRFVGADADAERLSSYIRGAWAAFARGEDPWARYDVTNRRTMELGRRIGVLDDPLRERRAIWEAA